MAVKANITCLWPKVLRVSEQLISAGNYVARNILCGLSLQAWKPLYETDVCNLDLKRKMLKANITCLMPLVLSLSEQLIYASSLVACKVDIMY